MDMMRLPLDLPAVVEDASTRLSTEEDRVRARGVACEGNVLVGRPDTEIVHHADKTHSDLIILGTHGRSGLPHVLLGSVAEKVVQHAHCPVLTVPSHHAAPTSQSR
jgi:nucleotide-binding universal stress UspA family protein